MHNCLHEATTLHVVTQPGSVRPARPKHRTNEEEEKVPRQHFPLTMSTTFRKGGRAAAVIPNTRPTPHATLTTSSGCSAIDGLIGGGIPLGSVLMIGRRHYSSLTHLLTSSQRRTRTQLTPRLC